MQSTPRVRCVVFAAGKSTRMGTGRSKMLELIERNGQTRPMLVWTTDLLVGLGYEVTVLIGYGGTEVCRVLQLESEAFTFVRVSLDDGSDLEPNTAGTLKKYARPIVQGLASDDRLLLCIGDQPFMRMETVRNFVRHHFDSLTDASILVADVRGTGMEHSTSTRVSISGSRCMALDTPPKDGPFDGYSTLVDVGLVVLKKSAFLAAVQNVAPDAVFSKLLCYLPPGADRIDLVPALDPREFANVNERHAVRQTQHRNSTKEP